MTEGNLKTNDEFKISMQKKKIEEKKNLIGLQNEQIHRNQEKLSALQIELRERLKQHKILNEKYNEESKNTTYVDSDITNKDEYLKEIKNNENDEMTLKIIDKLNVNLDRLINQIDDKLASEFHIEESENTNKDKEDKNYSKSSIIAVCVKYIEKIEIQTENNNKEINIKREYKEYYNTFRIAKNTMFKELKRTAIEFWIGFGQIENEIIHKKSEFEIDTIKDNRETKKRNKFYDNFEILDENFNAIIQENNTFVDLFFQQKTNDFNQAIIILRKKENNFSSKKDDNDNNQDDDPELQTKKIKTDEDIKVSEFYRKFPGLKNYFKIDAVKNKKDNKLEEGFILNDNYFCVFLWIMILFILTVVSIKENKNIFQININHDNILKLISAMPDFKTQVPQIDSIYYSIYNSNSLIDYLSGILGNQLFWNGSDSSDVNRVYKSYIISGGLYMRQIKIKQKQCPAYSTENFTCTYPYYTNDLKYIKVEGQSIIQDQKWNSYRGEKDTGVSNTFTGEFGEYDGSGYFQNFQTYPFKIPPGGSDLNEKDENKKSSRIQFNEIMAKIFNKSAANPYISLQTQAIFLNFNLYNPNQDIWTYLFEVAPTGVIFPYPAQLLHFKLNLYEGEGEILRVIDIITGIICVFLIIFILYFVFCTRQMGEFNFAYMFTFQGICNLMIVVLTYLSIGIANEQTGLVATTEDLIVAEGLQQYRDLFKKAYYYNMYFQIKGILLAVLIIRMMTIFKINKRFNIIITTLEKALSDITVYCIILFPLLLAYACIGRSIYGSRIVEFSTFFQSFTSILLMTIGHVNPDDLERVSPEGTFIFLLTFYIIIVFFLLSLFLGIYIDNYRLVILDIGFKYDEESSWEIKMYFKWMLNWLPKKWLKKLKLLKDEDSKKNNI